MPTNGSRRLQAKGRAAMERPTGGIRAAAGPLAAIVLTLGASALGGPAVSASQRTLYVDDDGHAGRTGCSGTKAVARRVQRAIRFARPGDTIMVCPGTYSERLTITGDRDGLTIRAVEPWTAIIRTPRELTDAPALITIDGVDRVRLRSLRLEAHTVEPCDRLWYAVRIRHAHDVEVRSLRIAPFGTNTIGPCGYSRGIVVHRGTSASIGDNLIQDFTAAGIWVYGTHTSANVYHNSIRYFPAAEPPGSRGAIGIWAGDIAPQVTIRDNVIRSGPGPGWTTPVLSYGMFLVLQDRSVVAGNRVQRTLYGILTEAFGDPPPGAVIRDNVITDGAPDADSTGLAISDASTYVRNRVSGYGIGAAADSGDDGRAVATLRDNDFRGNHSLDCFGGAPTIWIDNLGDTSDPPGLCSPGP